jgi:hypothetical protein
VGVSSLTVEVALEMRNFSYSPVVCGEEELRQRKSREPNKEIEIQHLSSEAQIAASVNFHQKCRSVGELQQLPEFGLPTAH